MIKTELQVRRVNKRRERRTVWQIYATNDDSGDVICTLALNPTSSQLSLYELAREHIYVTTRQIT